jgi:hypothetical protein
MGWPFHSFTMLQCWLHVVDIHSFAAFIWYRVYSHYLSFVSSGCQKNSISRPLQCLIDNRSIAPWRPSSCHLPGWRQLQSWPLRGGWQSLQWRLSIVDFDWHLIGRRPLLRRCYWTMGPAMLLSQNGATHNGVFLKMSHCWTVLLLHKIPVVKFLTSTIT